MPPKFPRGATVYARDERSYVVQEVEDGIVYCSSAGGAEAEFPEAALLTNAEWAARSDGRRNLLYTRLKQTRAYTSPTNLRPGSKLDRAASAQALLKIERLLPGILDFIAFTVAERSVEESGDADLLPGLSIGKCREIFEAAPPDVRAALLAGVLGIRPEVLVDAGRLGDNLMIAMLDKGLAARSAAFESFRDRRRR